MPSDEDVRESLLDDEHPGPKDLESVLANTTLSEVVSQPALIVNASATLGEAIALMQRERRACVLIEEHGALAGIFTERDVLMKVVGHSIDLERTPITASMTRDPFTLPADANVAFALSKMVLEGFRHIPLVDDDGRPTAVVSMRNLIEYLGEIHSRDMLTIPPEPHQARSRSREGA
ncbi:MAG: CBS domain-containing protein [Candidatus Binatus sp.]|uniref:CBS domain-containing protein n=1 Tax=Candidatus Binatus sp. TaxID=2811406 RepID=UPI002716C2DD|nr:CBS domain-containing protein [Candidatus Binatus sp.]MDO8430885.1 CBS domain-containing protein [Candidatus Binatus sp.]